MPEKKVQRIEKIQFANMGYKAVGIYARVSTCLPAFSAPQYGYAGFCADASGLPFAVLESG